MAGPNEVLDKGVYLDAPTPVFSVVKLAATVDHATVCDTLGEAWFGIAQEGADQLDVDRGRVIRVRPMGISRGLAGANDLAIGDRVTTNASGQLIVAVATNHVVGILLSGSTAVGDWVNVLLTPGVIQA